MLVCGLEGIGNILPYIGRINYRQNFEDRATVYVSTMFNTAYMKLNILTSVDSVIYYWARHRVTTHI